MTEETNKMPPNAADLEQAVLGALMLEHEHISSISDILIPESFYVEKNAVIYSAIIRLFKKGEPADILTLSQEIKRVNKVDFIGGYVYLSGLINRVASSANIEFHARIIQQKFIQRELIRIGTETIKEAYKEDSDCFDTVESLEKSLTAINKNFSSGKVKTIASMWSDVVDHNYVLLTKKGISGVPSGYLNLDVITGGWQQPDLIIVAARPAMGKTSLACNFARNASVDFDIPGAIFSLEMSSRQIATRIFSLESEVPISEFSRRGIPDDQMMYVQRDCLKLINSSLFIDDTPSISIMELRSKARKLKREQDIKFIVVDYLQLMSGDKNANKGGNREQEISGISRGLKSLAKELEVPIIALSQLSRAVETRGGDKRPVLSDLRESGAIEQDADIVIFIHRPEYYGITQYEEGESTAGIAEIIFAKHRNGSIGTEKLKFIDRLTKFMPIDFAPVNNSFTSAMQPNYKDFSVPDNEAF